MGVIKTPLRYPNGKQREAEGIVSKFPSNTKEIRDIMCGGGSISFKSRERFPEAKIWMNDSNSDLINFIEKASYDNKEMVMMVIKWMSEHKGKDLFKFCKDKLMQEKLKVLDANHLEMATAFYIINRLAYSGTLNGGYTEYNYHNRLTFNNLTRLKTMDGFIRRNWMVTNESWEHIVDAPSKFNNDEVLIFANPPYYNDDMQMYHKSINHGNQFPYKLLADKLATTKYKFLVAVDDSRFIRDIFSFANIISKSTLDGNNDIRKNKVVPRDLLYITNY